LNFLAQHRLVRFRRRVHCALFLGGFVDATALLLLLAAMGLLTCRLMAWPPPAWHPAYAALGLIPCAFGVFRAWRRALPSLTRAAHLDQRLALDGLLLSACEADAAAWEVRLADGLRRATARMPRLRVGLLTGRLLLPGVLFAAACLLPQTQPPAPRVDKPLAQALADLQSELELAKQEGVLPQDKIDELVRRAAELHDAAQQGEQPTWADVDELQARLQQERALQQDALAKTAHALRALQEASRNAGAQSQSGSSFDAQAQMQELLQHAAAAGLLDKLPKDLDPSRGAKAGDADAFEQLAQALAQTALEQVEAQRGQAGEGEGLALEDLAEVLRGMQGEGEGPGGDTAVGEGPGRGGITRGPGHATLELNENFDGDTSALQAHKLPPGRVVKKDWEVMQSRRVDPEVNPQRNTQAGGEAAAGAGEAAWQRRLSPSHRAVVREFFTSKRAPGAPGAPTQPDKR
jgi:hypothetical protein